MPSTGATGTGTAADLEQMFQIMETETIAWARKMEELILPVNKCSAANIQSCNQENYNGCNSEFPFATCPGGENRILACGQGNEGGCSGLFDFTTSKVSLAASNSFTSSNRVLSKREKDGVCSTRSSDEWVSQARGESRKYWQEYKVTPPWYHYGNENGMFRMLPGTPEECPSGESAYDPRVRPWYTAASSGPKDIILILDTSCSCRYGKPC